MSLSGFAKVGSKPENCWVVLYVLAQIDFILPLIDVYVATGESAAVLCFHWCGNKQCMVSLENPALFKSVEAVYIVVIFELSWLYS